MLEKKDDGLTPKTTVIKRCPQCQAALQHVTRGGQQVLECPNGCRDNKGKSAAISIKEPTEELAATR